MPPGSEEPTLTGSVTGLGPPLVIPQSPVFTAPTVQTEMALALSATEGGRTMQRLCSVKRCTLKLSLPMPSPRCLFGPLAQLGIEKLTALEPVPSVQVQARLPWHAPCRPRLSTVPALNRPC